MRQPFSYLLNWDSGCDQDYLAAPTHVRWAWLSCNPFVDCQHPGEWRKLGNSIDRKYKEPGDNGNAFSFT
jgi:hypothetical protein